MSRSRVEQNVREIGYKNQILERLAERTAVKLIRSNNGPPPIFVIKKEGRRKLKILALLIALELEGLPTAVKSETKNRKSRDY